MSAKSPFSLVKKALSRMSSSLVVRKSQNHQQYCVLHMVMFFQFKHCYPVWIQLQVFFLSSCLVEPYVTSDGWHNLQTDILDHLLMRSEMSTTLSFVKTLSPPEPVMPATDLLLINHCTRQWCHTWESRYIYSNSCLTSVCTSPQQNMSHQKNPQVSLTIPLAQNTTMHPSRSLSAAQLAVNAELGLHDRSLMPLDVYYVWDFPTSHTVPHPSCTDALTCFTHSVFLVPHIIVYHECIYEACR